MQSIAGWCTVVVALAASAAPVGDGGLSAPAPAADDGAVKEAPADAADGGEVAAPGSTAIEDLGDLEALLELPTVSSAKVSQRAAVAPAVVTVITSEELVARGYTSVADALRVVPGFYDVYDLVTHNIGVRGVNGGARASGSPIKLMIDGMPVDFRPTTGNFFGEELIPLAAVDRVEIIRGPASALYGANAYLGVVNVITKKGAGVDGVRLLGHGAVVQGHPGGGSGLLAGAAGEKFDVLAAAEFLWTDRSGLTVPASSPTDVSARGASVNDFARSKSFFAKASFDQVLRGKLTLTASMQALDARAEFQDFWPLTHRTRLGWVNQNYRALWELELNERLSVQLSGNAFFSDPSPEERIDVGRTDYVLLRRIGGHGVDAAGEVHYRPLEWLSLTGGVDFVSEHHVRQTFAQLLTEDVLSPGGTVVRSKGTIVPGVGVGDMYTFYNFGAFLQGMAQVGQSFNGIVGVRVDEHSLYHTNLSGRFGVVYAPPDRPLSLKVLVGTSFKAPSAVQLYTYPMAVRDVQGNPDLKAQTAQTAEVALLTALPKGLGEVSVSAFGMATHDMVEFQQTGLYLQAKNVLDEFILGAELESRLRLTEPFRLRLSASLARTVSTTAATTPTSELPVNPLFPWVQAHAIAEYHLPFAKGVVASAEVSVVGPRASSQSNALLLGHPYELPPYVYTAASVAWSGTLFGARPTSVSLRASNPFGLSWADPGFGGTDVPSRGATFMLNLSQGL